MQTAIMPTPATSESQHPSRLFDVPDGADLSVDDCNHPCCECARPIPYNTILRDCGWGKYNTCPDCLSTSRRHDSEDKEIEEAVKFETATDTIRKIIPPLYLSTDPERLPYKERQTVLAWQAKKRAKGLWMVGDTRRGKTRCVCLLLERLIKEGVKVRAFFHGSFGVELIEVIRSEKSFREWRHGVTRADVLVIDDLFVDKMTERVEAAVFEIIDERISFYRPTIVTTQLTAKAAENRFHSDQRCAAFFARIKEFFEIIRFERDEQTALGVGG